MSALVEVDLTVRGLRWIDIAEEDLPVSGRNAVLLDDRAEVVDVVLGGVQVANFLLEPSILRDRPDSVEIGLGEVNGYDSVRFEVVKLHLLHAA